MKIGTKNLAVGAALLAVATGALGSGIALASTTGNGGQPIAWQPDAANYLGGLSFYDAAGHQVTSGSINDTPFAAYYVTGASASALGGSATVYTTTPAPGDPSTWVANQLTSSQAEPKSSLPGDLAGYTGGVVADDSGLSFQQSQISGAPNASTTSGYQNLYEIRLYGGNNPDQSYVADIAVSGTTWTQVYPNQTAPTVTITSPSGSTGTSGSAVTLTASVGTFTGMSGKVQFFDSTTPVGTAQSVTAAAPTASVSTTPAQGSHSYTAVFTPTPGTTGLKSTSAAKSFSVAAPATATTLSLFSQSVGTYANDPATLVVDLTPTSATGSVQVKDNGTVLGTASPVAGTPGRFSYSTTALGQGNHALTAQFLSNDTAAFNDSNVVSGTPFSYVGSPTVGDPSTSNVTTDVKAGIVTITTPYGPGSQFDLGTLQLDANAQYLVATKQFPAAADPAITVTDTRAGDLPWTATVTSSDLTGVADATRTINGQNFGFAPYAATYPAGNALAGKVDVFSTAPGAGLAPGDTGSLGLKGGPVFAKVHTGQSGVGTAFIRGDLTLKAPTSTQADRYNGLLTFTVIGS